MLTCPCMFLPLVYAGIFIGTFLVVSIAVVVLVLRRIIQKSKAKRLASSKQLSVAFFHPYCNAGGGGERVLWCAVRALQNK